MPSVSSAKLNNFSRLEPTLHLLGVQFDQKVASNIITEKPGAATKLLYQLYTTLQKKKKSGLTGAEMQTMQPLITMRLQNIKSEAFRDVSTEANVRSPSGCTCPLCGPYVLGYSGVLLYINSVNAFIHV